MSNISVTTLGAEPNDTGQVLKTKYLFLNLLKLFKPKLILDVGSMDGADSIRFRKMSKGSKIVAFEANPYHFAKMCNDNRLSDMAIAVRPLMVSCTETSGKFYITKGAVPGTAAGNTGTSSSMQPVNAADVAEEIEVDTIRLGKVISDTTAADDLVALWIDVEGAAYDVLSSVIGFEKRIGFLHIEVELAEFWVGQKLKNDVIQLANKLGLVLLAHTDNEKQQDLVLINAALLKDRAGTVKLATMLTKWLGPASSRILERV